MGDIGEEFRFKIRGTARAVMGYGVQAVKEEVKVVDYDSRVEYSRGSFV
jgi:hypothetical protein